MTQGAPAVPSSAQSSEGALKLDPKILELLVCPLTKSPLIFDRKKCELISVAARLAFPIRKSIPLLFVGEARELTDEEIEAHRH